jgi:SAM-dependent methyltransferase
MQYLIEESERHYRELKRHGAMVGWRGQPFEQFLFRPFLEFALSRLTFPCARPRALEYGTGTGPGACFLAARGFEVEAVDVCPTAIELARTFAAQQRLRIRYEVRDIRDLPCRDRRYDLVVDNYCLHFHIADEDRRRVFEVVRSVLTSGGAYVVGTVTHQEGRDYQERMRDPATGIVYRRATDADAALPGFVRRDGHCYVPNRRHVTREFLRAEVERAGFEVLFQKDGHLICKTAAADKRQSG